MPEGNPEIFMRLHHTILLALAFAAAPALWAATPSPALLVLNKEVSLAIIDPATGAVTGRVPTGNEPHEVAASSDGKLAFTSNYGSYQPGMEGHTISVIDLAAQKEIHRVDLTPLQRPHGLYFSDGKLYFTVEANKAIGRYDPVTNKVDWVLGTGQNTTHMVHLSRDGSMIFTANIGSGSISIFERGSGRDKWNQLVIPVGKDPEGFDVTPNERELWAANGGDGRVSVIDLASKKVARTFDIHTKRSNRLKFTPDGNLALVSDLGTGDLVVLDGHTGAERKRINLGHGIAGILITPDGSRAYVAATSDNNVAIVNLETLTVEGRLHTGKGPDGMAWAGTR
jgi:DNA-binding beta-propeller fold protein YncE